MTVFSLFFCVSVQILGGPNEPLVSIDLFVGLFAGEVMS